MLILIFILCFSACAQEIEVIPEDKDVSDEIHEIATLEMSIGERMRDDKVDRTIQEDIEESIARMEKLIKDADAADEGDPDSKRKEKLLKMKGVSKPGDPPKNIPEAVTGAHPEDDRTRG